MALLTTSILDDMLIKNYKRYLSNFTIMINVINLKDGWSFAGYEKYKKAYGKHIRYRFYHCTQTIYAVLIENQKTLKVTCKTCNQSIEIPDWQLFALSLAMKK